MASGPDFPGDGTDNGPDHAAGPEAGETTASVASSSGGGLVLVSTPIGNLGDISPRAVEVLRTATVVLCEDTRRTARLLSALSLSARTEALHDHNEEQRIPAVLRRLREGQTVALVSDAGTPVFADPGFRLVRAVIEAGLPVTLTPGPVASVAALVLSGLPPLPHLTLGFLPPKASARGQALARLRSLEAAGLAATLVFYEAPHRLAETLADMEAAFGPDRPAAVARELTKRFEEVRRGPLGSLAAHYASAEALGEIVVVVGPAPEDAEAGQDDAVVDALLRTALRAASVRDAAQAVALVTGLPRKAVYARALLVSGATDGPG